MQLLHETRILAHTRDTKRLRLGTNSIDQIIVWDSRRANSTLDGRIVFKRDGLVNRLYLVQPDPVKGRDKGEAEIRAKRRGSVT